MKVHLYFLFIISSLFFVPVLNAGFTENNEDIVNLEGSSLCWGDYDNDGDMDFVIMGRDASGEERTLLYENRGSGNFVLKQNIGEGLYNGSMAWADYDKDGDLDLAISGYSTENSLGLTKLYENDNGFFEDSGLEFQNVYKSDIAWGDYNNDGNYDLAVSGLSGGNYYTIVYRNNGDGSFSEMDFELDGAAYSSLAWADYNNDGFQDLAVTGKYVDETKTSYLIGKIYKNNKGSLSNDNVEDIIKTTRGDIKWGDYDNDGNLDFAIMGSTSTFIEDCFLKIYRNQGPPGYTFVSTKTFTTGIWRGELAWGDYDNDGDLDLAAAGVHTNADTFSTKIYDNVGGGEFTDSGISLEDIGRSAIGFSDYDEDKDIDFLISGSSGTAGQFSALFDNNEADGGNPNHIPPRVEDFYSRHYNGKLYIMWNDPPKSDTETVKNGLYYNFRVGTSSGSDNLVPARYGSPLFGNYLSKATSSTWVSHESDPDIDSGDIDVSGYKNVRVLNISGSNYYWAVQTIDTSLGYSWASSYGNDWSEQQVFIDSTPPTGVADIPLDEGKYTYNKTMTFNLSTGTAQDPETGIHGCYVQIKEIDPEGGETIVKEEEISDKLTKTIWNQQGQASYKYTGELNNTYKVRIKARHGYNMNLPTSTYITAEFEGTEPEWLWNPKSPHYTQWSDWSDGIMPVELLTVNKNIIRNPGEEYCEIGYRLTRNSTVRIRIFDIMGDLVKTILDERVEVDNETIEKWYGKNKNGAIVASGVYLANIQASGSEDTKKIIIIR